MEEIETAAAELSAARSTHGDATRALEAARVEFSRSMDAINAAEERLNRAVEALVNVGQPDAG